MVHDLLQNHLLVNETSRDTVKAKLGVPAGEVTIKSGKSYAKCGSYNLGWCSGLGWDPDSLFVCYDEKGFISQSGHVQH